MAEKKLGRPKGSVNPYRESFRLSQEDINKIHACMETEGISKTDVIRKGIDLAYHQLPKIQRDSEEMVEVTCTIPAWMDDEATALGINFSQVLQDALAQKLTDVL